MKKIGLLFLGVLFAFNISAQDLGVSEIVVKSKVDTGWALVPGDTVLLNDTVYLGVVLKNFAGAIVSTTDSIAYGVSINGLPIGALGGFVGKNVPSNVGFNTAEMILKKDQVFSIAAASVEVCAWPIYWSQGGMGGTLANDTGCATYTIWDRVITVNDFSPIEGKAGIDVTINGSYFSAVAADNVVKFNGETAVIKSATANKIVATVPANALSGKITVEAQGKTATSAEGFTVLDAEGNPKNPVSISEINAISSFVGFSNNELVISTGNVSSDLKIFDLTGKIVSSVSNIPSNTQHAENLNELQSGVYIATYGSQYLKFSK